MERVEPIFTTEEVEAPSGPSRGYQSLATVKHRRDRDPDAESDDSSWTDQVEEYIRDILKKCEEAAKAHEKCAYAAKTKHARYAFPGTLIPTIAAPIMGTFKDETWTPYFGMSAMVVTAICSGFSNFFNFGAKSQQHFNFAGRYGDIVTDIQECLHKKIDKRISGSVAMRTFKMKYDALALSAPET